MTTLPLDNQLYFTSDIQQRLAERLPIPPVAAIVVGYLHVSAEQIQTLFISVNQWPPIHPHIRGAIISHTDTEFLRTLNRPDPLCPTEKIGHNYVKIFIPKISATHLTMQFSSRKWGKVFVNFLDGITTQVRKNRSEARYVWFRTKPYHSPEKSLERQRTALAALGCKIATFTQATICITMMRHIHRITLFPNEAVRVLDGRVGGTSIGYNSNQGLKVVQSSRNDPLAIVIE